MFNDENGKLIWYELKNGKFVKFYEKIGKFVNGEFIEGEEIR